MDQATIQHLKQINDVLCCPKCAGNLEVNSDIIQCLNCRQSYQVSDNIPLLFWPNEWDPAQKDVTDIVRNFYEKTPFPNYDDLDNAGSLIQKARQGVFAKLLDEQIPFGTRVLECGCGTGQLSNFLSIADRTVMGTDICLNSLKLGQDFKERNQLKRVHFLQMNLFRPVFKSETFDLVICNGVLHHTSDPFGGYKGIARLVKPNGYIIIGLYHQWGRILTDIRRIIFNLTQDRFRSLDPRLRGKNLGETRKNTWFADQYKHPHESKHTIREVLDWFKESGFNFVKSIPRTSIFATVADEETRLFKAERSGDTFELFLAELKMMFTDHKEGGFFVVIGQKIS
ncbi:MAG: methyltransferase domain-containing protein [Deltaproteobacteria bacterium]|nr:methyltransferase domain-containing protein [Deltaproteobacteria bacterium]